MRALAKFFASQQTEKFEEKKNKNIIILNNDPMYYFEIVLKLKKKFFVVKQITSFENLLLELENGKTSYDKYDKIVIDLDFINEHNLKDFLKMKKNNLFIATSDIDKVDEDLKNSIQVIIEKTKKEKFVETLCEC